MKISIDRFEGKFAVVITDNGEIFNVPKELLKDGKEGDVFCISKDENETLARKERIGELANKLWK